MQLFKPGNDDHPFFDEKSRPLNIWYLPSIEQIIKISKASEKPLDFTSKPPDAGLFFPDEDGYEELLLQDSPYTEELLKKV